MSDAPIFFEFDQDRSAYLALDTLQELGYRPDFVEGAGKPTLHIHVDKQDLTSALEIAQACGGKLTERVDGLQDGEAYSLAYDLNEGIAIPAHVVTEDFTESYAHPSPDAYGPPDAYDLSGETYDGFSPGVHL
jgi:hypothetical protein